MWREIFPFFYSLRDVERRPVLCSFKRIEGGSFFYITPEPASSPPKSTSAFGMALFLLLFLPRLAHSHTEYIGCFPEFEHHVTRLLTGPGAVFLLGQGQQAVFTSLGVCFSGVYSINKPVLGFVFGTFSAPVGNVVSM